VTQDFIGGIDIGGTKIAVAIAQPNGPIVARETFATAEESTPESAMRRAIAALQSESEVNNGRLEAIGVGCAGPIDFETGKLFAPPNLPRSWTNFEIQPFAEKESGVLVVAENDANAAALGEHRFGAGRNFSDFVYLTISTGIGGGIIADGKLSHRLGEAGHVIVQPGGDPCGCGSHGCLEAMCAGPAIARRARVHLQTTNKSQMGAANELTARTVVEALRDGDEVAQHIWQETIAFMAIGISSIVALLAPQAVILGGGVAAGAGELLLKPLREGLKEHVHIIPIDRVQILGAGLGADSGLYGTLALASDLLKNRAA